MENYEKLKKDYIKKSIKCNPEYQVLEQEIDKINNKIQATPKWIYAFMGIALTGDIFDIWSLALIATLFNANPISSSLATASLITLGASSVMLFMTSEVNRRRVKRCGHSLYLIEAIKKI